jgi:hypothetical protein
MGMLGGWQERAQADTCREAETEGEGGAHDWEAGGSPVDAFSWGSIVLGGGPLNVGSEFERRLSIGANIACRLRGAVREQLGESVKGFVFLWTPRQQMDLNVGQS